MCTSRNHHGASSAFCFLQQILECSIQENHTFYIVIWRKSLNGNFSYLLCLIVFFLFNCYSLPDVADWVFPPFTVLSLCASLFAWKKCTFALRQNIPPPTFQEHEVDHFQQGSGPLHRRETPTTPFLKAKCLRSTPREWKWNRVSIRWENFWE